MKTGLQVVLAVLLITAFGSLHAQEIVTDRPDQTESAEVVQKNRVQIETGYLYEDTGDDPVDVKSSSVGTLIRYGLLDILELRTAIEYRSEKVSFSSQSGLPTESNSGFAPLSLGAKLLVTRERGAMPQTALLFHVGIPDAASDGFKSAYAGPSLKVCMSNTLDERFSLGYNIGGEMDPFTNDLAGIYTVSLGASLNDKIGAFAELFGSVGEEHRINADGGLTYKIQNNLQLDVSGGLNLDTKDYFVGTGISVRFPK